MQQVVHVSKHEAGKLQNFLAVNTNTLTNDFCQKMHSAKGDTICKDCYSWDMLHGSRKNCQVSFERNSQLLSTAILDTAQLPLFNSLWVRIDAHGELINEIHFHNIVLIARHNPETTITLFTKRKKIVWDWIKKHGEIPNNLILVFSNPKKDKIRETPPRYFHKVFNTVTRPHKRENCTGQKCINCLACYRFDGKSVLIERVKKRA